MRPHEAKRAVAGLRVGILKSRDEGLAHGEAHDALAVQSVGEEADGIREACAANGWTPVDVEAARDPHATLASLRDARVDVVFQLAESIGGDARLEAAAAWMLEWARVPFTGSGPEAITLALRKPLARAVLAAAGVPIPAGIALESADDPLDEPRTFADARARWIVKPSREDASHGIALESVVAGEAAVRARAAYVIRTYHQPALIEEFVDGREFNVGILGTGPSAETLPLAEIDFRGFPEGAPKLVTFKAKWDPASAEYQGSMPAAPRELSPELERSIRARALSAYHAIGLAGYGRVDVRVCARRGPLVVDVNPNPDISPDAGLARAAARGGIPHAELVSRIVREALERAGRAASAAGV